MGGSVGVFGGISCSSNLVVFVNRSSVRYRQLHWSCKGIHSRLWLCFILSHGIVTVVAFVFVLVILLES